MREREGVGVADRNVVMDDDVEVSKERGVWVRRTMPELPKVWEVPVEETGFDRGRCSDIQ
jgi:hypothetical protein